MCFVCYVFFPVDYEPKGEHQSNTLNTLRETPLHCSGTRHRDGPQHVSWGSMWLRGIPTTPHPYLYLSQHGETHSVHPAATRDAREGQYVGNEAGNPTRMRFDPVNQFTQNVPKNWLYLWVHVEYHYFNLFLFMYARP